MKALLTIVVYLVLTITPALADEYRPAYLEFTQTTSAEFDVLWKVPARGQAQRLSLYVQLPDDVTQTNTPRSAFIGNAFIERWSVYRKGGLVGAIICIQGLERVATDVLVRIQRLDGSSETTRLKASATSFVVKGSPQFWDVVKPYLVFGVEHILGGIDHLLLVACLIFIAGTWRRILVTITGFTLAHSITLTLSALDLVRLPMPPIEAVIALSIVFLGREIALNKRDTLTWKYPIAVSASFGLLHGFGFASALSDIGLPQTEIPAALLAFNVGVEIGQVLFMLTIIGFFMLAVRLIKYFECRSNKWFFSIEKVAAYSIGSVATLWTLERVSVF